MDNLGSIVKDYVERSRERYPNFPQWYCNIASKELKKILDKKGILSDISFSYLEPWDGHTFLITEDNTIIDPTYEQIDPCCLGWFVGASFPNKTLQKNITLPTEYMQLQQERNEQWI